MDKDEKKKDERKKPTYKKYRTGEDIDMLNERYSDPQSGSWGTVRYKDDIDGARIKWAYGLFYFAMPLVPG